MRSSRRFLACALEVGLVPMIATLRLDLSERRSKPDIVQQMSTDPGSTIKEIRGCSR
jgi:hypothetical protein